MAVKTRTNCEYSTAKFVFQGLHGVQPKDLLWDSFSGGKVAYPQTGEVLLLILYFFLFLLNS